MKLIVYSTLVFLLVSCGAKESEEILLQGNAFGTTYNIRMYASDRFNAQKGVDSVVEAVNRSVSTYIPTSDISKINKGDTTVVVDKIFKDVYVLSEKVHEQSSGYFDPTVGVLRNAYGFGDVKPLQKIDSLTLDSLMQYVGFQKVKMTPEGRIIKENPNVYFDFNAVAKGYGIDRIGVYLKSKGVANYLIELGGELLAKGKNLSKQKDWIVGIEAVTSDLDDRSFAAKVKLINMALAASGNYRKTRIDSVTGKRYVHTINPLTGSAEKSDVTSATILAPTCAEADAYATACMALGMKGAKEMLKNVPAIEAYLTYNDSLGNEKVFITEGFKIRLVE